MADKIKVDRELRFAFSIGVRRTEKGSTFLRILRMILVGISLFVSVQIFQNSLHLKFLFFQAEL